jgi:hypothetical protein
VVETYATTTTSRGGAVYNNYNSTWCSHIQQQQQHVVEPYTTTTTARGGAVYTA